MRLSKALKYKKKLIKLLEEDMEKIHTYNSSPSNIERVYNPMDCFTSYKKRLEELINLKAAIQKANVPVYDKIFRLSELKNVIIKLKRIPTEEGEIRYGNSEPLIRTVIFNKLTIDNLIKESEDQIETIQEELESYNATTEITW